MSHWHLQLFGNLEARGDNGQVVARFRTRKTASLLALLALKGAQPRETLCEWLWPEAAPEAARNSLSAALSALRRDFGEDAVCADRFRVELEQKTFQTDVALFDEALRNGDVSSAVALYRNHLLPGFYEESLLEIAREYEEKARHAFESALQQGEAEGRYADVAALARRGVSLFPSALGWYVVLMRAHHALRQFDAALEAFKQLGQAAQKENELVPDAARHLARQIRRDREIDTAIAPAPAAIAVATPTLVPVAKNASVSTSPNIASTHIRDVVEELPFQSSDVEAAQTSVLPPAPPLPQSWTTFFGRETEIESLLDCIARGDSFITLTGMGGTGKTRLALEVARRLKEQPVYFVSLAALSDAELLFSFLRDALHLVAAPDLPPLQQLASVLRDSAVILILDNFEQLVESGAAPLQQLREALPQATFLVTSRVLLNLPGEREWPVAPLPTPRVNTNLESCPSSALFLDRARAARPNFALTAENSADIRELCRYLDGIPLALELAAARIRVLAPAQILERLRQQLDFLQTREHGVPERQRTLRATIEWSYHQLPTEQQEFFNSLSVFRGGWTLEAAEAVCTQHDGDVLDFLERLREYSMITTQDTPGCTRFRMLEVLREWGAAKLETEQSQQLRASHFDYFLDFIESANDAVSLMQRRAELEAESDNFRRALSWTIEREDTESANDASRLAGALCPWWESRALYSEGREWVLRVLRKDGEVEPKWRALLLRGAGSLSLCCGDLAPAQSLLEEARLLSHSLDDSWGEAYILHRLSVAMLLRGQLGTSMTYAEQSLERARKIGDPTLLFGGFTAVGWAYHNTNRHSEAQTIIQECLELARQIGVRQIEALSYALLGYSHALQSHIADGIRYADDGVRVAQQYTEVDDWCSAFTRAIRSLIAREAGDYDFAREGTPRALKEFFRIGSRWEFVSALNDCGMLATDLEQWNLAAQMFGVADALGERIGYRLLLSISCLREPRFEKLREVLGEAELQRQMQSGAQLPLETAIEMAQQLRLSLSAVA